MTRNTDICFITDNNSLLRHIDFTEDTSDKTTNEKDRPELTPETATHTAKVGSHVSEV